jgi:hypothetical protein
MAIEWTVDEEAREKGATLLGRAPSGQTFIIEDLDTIEGECADRPRFLTGACDLGDEDGGKWEPIDGADTLDEAKQIAEEIEAEWVADPESRPRVEDAE